MTELEEAIAYRDLKPFTLDEVKKWVPTDAAGHERKGRLLKTIAQLEPLWLLHLARHEADALKYDVQAWMETEGYEGVRNAQAPMWGRYEAARDKLNALRDRFKL